ncbi:unnamed protein product, partial [marine sediment metagenome]
AFWLSDAKETFWCYRSIGTLLKKLRQGAWPGLWLPRLLEEKEDPTPIFDELQNFMVELTRWTAGHDSW